MIVAIERLGKTATIKRINRMHYGYQSINMATPFAIETVKSIIDEIERGQDYTMHMCHAEYKILHCMMESHDNLD